MEYNLNNIIESLELLSKINSKTKRELLIIGGASFMLREMFNRGSTTDVDSFLLKDGEISDVKKIFKGEESFHLIFNSKAYPVVYDILKYEDEFEEVLVDRFPNLKIFVPNLNTSIVMKIVAFTNRNYKDVQSNKDKNKFARYKDMEDISDPKIFMIADKQKIENDLIKWFNDKSADQFKFASLDDYLFVLEK